MNATVLKGYRRANLRRPYEVLKVLKSLLPLTFLLCFALFPVWTSAETLEGYVFKVHDGDTIWVLDHEDNRHKIRLAGIDAPEVKQVGGNAATRALAEMIVGKIVTVEYHKRDRNKRLVGIIMDGQYDICASMVKQGYAWHFTKYAREQNVEDREWYSSLEQEARKAKRGLWLQPNPLPPWEWRKR